MPTEGQTELNIHKKIDVRISAAEAERRCNSWLCGEISMGFLATTPDFCVGEDGRSYWRVPINYATASVGIVGEVGEVEVDVTTGEISHDEAEIDLWYEQARRMVKTLPPFKPFGIEHLPPAMVPPPHLRAPVIKLSD